VSDPQPPQFLWTLFEQLRRRRLPLGIEDYVALRSALRAGFGLSSRDALRDLCVRLWAKSLQEAEVVQALFERSNLDGWDVPTTGGHAAVEPGPLNASPVGSQPTQEPSLAAKPRTPPGTTGIAGLPALPSPVETISDRRFVLTPQFPLTRREIAQAWRRLRRPVRSGPPTELDVDATIARRSSSGVATPLVLVPRRRNTARLLLLIDRQGSMAPYHGYTEHVRDAIQSAGRLERVSLFYFHNVPVKGADRTLIESITDRLSSTLDAVLSSIEPLTEGHVYEDQELVNPRPLKAVLDNVGPATAGVVISDAGAARGTYSPLRLLDTVAFLKAMRLQTAYFVWLNPVPTSDWPSTTAAQLARHVPMFPLDREGIDRAVNVLRGHPAVVERPL
jgi:uncharacterized protein with von Willebrand factor type A (vWA) domain